MSNELYCSCNEPTPDPFPCPIHGYPPASPGTRPPERAALLALAEKWDRECRQWIDSAERGSGDAAFFALQKADIFHDCAKDLRAAIARLSPGPGDRYEEGRRAGMRETLVVVEAEPLPGPMPAHVTAALASLESSPQEIVNAAVVATKKSISQHIRALSGSATGAPRDATALDPGLDTARRLLADLAKETGTRFIGRRYCKRCGYDEQHPDHRVSNAVLFHGFEPEPEPPVSPRSDPGAGEGEP